MLDDIGLHQEGFVVGVRLLVPLVVDASSRWTDYEARLFPLLETGSIKQVDFVKFQTVGGDGIVSLPEALKSMSVVVKGGEFAAHKATELCGFVFQEVFVYLLCIAEMANLSLLSPDQYLPDHAPTQP